MSDTATDVPEHPQFTCQTCGRAWPWAPQRAGKKAQCTCGHLMRVPTEPDTQVQDDAEDLYDFVEDEFQPTKVAARGRGDLCPSCGGSLTAGAVLCVGCGFDLRTHRKIGPGADAPVAPGPGGIGEDLQRKLGVAPMRTRLGTDDDAFARPEPAWRTTYLPLVMVILGIVLTFVSHLYVPDKGWIFGTHCLVPGLTDLGTNLATTVAACFGIAAIVGFDFPNDLATTILKLCAVALLPSAIADVMGAPLDELNGALVSVLGGAVFTFLGFIALFRLPVSDAAMCVLGIVILHGAREWLLDRVAVARSDSWI